MSNPEKKTKSNLGDYLKTGGPGRPKGSKNKFTKFKDELLEIWEDTNGKERLLQLIKRDRDFKEFITKMVIPVLPKDPLIVNEEHTHITYVWKSSDDRLLSPEVPARDTQKQG